MTEKQFPILRQCDAGEIRRLRESGRFFWVDLSRAEGASPDEVARAFGLSEAARGILFDFDPSTPPARRGRVEEELIVFAFWCAATPNPPATEGAGALGLFRVNVCVHGDFLLTVHDRAFDLPAVIGSGGIPPGRSERYAVYVVLDGMSSTLIEAIDAIERQVAELETRLLDSQNGSTQTTTRPKPEPMIRALRSRLTTLRIRIASERGIFSRVGEEIEHVPALESDRETYFQRIEGLLDRAIDRIDAASSARSHILDVQLNETTFRLTVIATVFLPLTFLTGFFGMNFGWLVDHIDSAPAFWLLGVGLMTGPLLLVLALLRGRAAAMRLRRMGQRLIAR